MQLDNLRILVADDEKTLTTLLTHILEQAGATVLAVSDGHEAVQQAPTFLPDIILTDLRMPGVNGHEAITSLHLVMPEVPILVISAYTDEENVAEAMNAGASACLPKPFQTAALLERIATLTGRQEGSSPF